MWFRTTQEKDVIGLVTYVPVKDGDTVNLCLFMPQGPPLSREGVQRDRSDLTSPTAGLWRPKL